MPPSECIQAASELLSRMDTKADPCEDFYQVGGGQHVCVYVTL